MVIAAAGAATAGVVALAGRLGIGDKKKENGTANTSAGQPEPTATVSTN